jgi:hypothetical protein
VTALAEIISEACGALGVGVEVFTDPTMLVQLPNGNDGLPADVGVLHYHGIRGLKHALDGVVSSLLGVSSPRLVKSLYAVLGRPSSRSTRRGCGVAPTSFTFPLRSRDLVLLAATPQIIDIAAK